eukprot:gene22979-biopygen20790
MCNDQRPNVNGKNMGSTGLFGDNCLIWWSGHFNCLIWMFFRWIHTFTAPVGVGVGVGVGIGVGACVGAGVGAGQRRRNSAPGNIPGILGGPAPPPKTRMHLDVATATAMWRAAHFRAAVHDGAGGGGAGTAGIRRWRGQAPQSWKKTWVFSTGN